MSTDRPIDQTSDAELFRGALSDEPPAAEPPAPAPQETPAEPQQAQEPAAVEQPRDEHGRWAPRTPTPDQAEQAPAAATPQQPEPDAVPSWRLRELREQREAEANRARSLEAELADMRRRHAAMEQQVRQQRQEPVQVPDLIADPAAYHAHVEQTFNERLRNMEANFSFRIAHSANGEMFEQAYGDMISRAERGDPSIVRMVMQSPDPGTAMINWYRREQTLQKVGNDPDAWFQRQLDERLKDPKFAGGIVDKIRNGSQPAPGGQQPSGVPTEFQIPPSLNRVAASASNTEAIGDLTDASLFKYATR